MKNKKPAPIQAELLEWFRMLQRDVESVSRKLVEVCDKLNDIERCPAFKDWWDAGVRKAQEQDARLKAHDALKILFQDFPEVKHKIGAKLLTMMNSIYRDKTMVGTGDLADFIVAFLGDVE